MNMKTKTDQLKIVVVGGGAGGLELVTQLGRKLGKTNKAHICLIDKSPAHIWKPLLHTVAAGKLDVKQNEVNYLAHAAQNGYAFQQGEMIKLNRNKKQLLLAPILDKKGQVLTAPRKITYDKLIIGVGSRANTFNIPGADKHCYFLNSKEDAAVLNTLMMTKLMQSTKNKISQKQKRLSIAIIGAGPTGVELASAMMSTLQQAIKQNQALSVDLLLPRISVIEAGKRVLPHLPEKMAAKAHERLSKMGVSIYPSQRVSCVSDKGVKTAAGITLQADIVVWVAGIKAPEWLGYLKGLEVNSVNQLVVKSTLQTTNDDDVFAFGDCCGFEEKPGQIVPARAQAAHQQADLLSRSFVGMLKGRAPRCYKYKDYGSLVNLSTSGTLGLMMGMCEKSFMIKGVVARLMYLSLYKMHQFKVERFSNWVVIVLKAMFSRKGAVAR